MRSARRPGSTTPTRWAWALGLALVASGCPAPPAEVPDDGAWQDGSPPPPPEPPAATRGIPPKERTRWARADELAGLTAVPGRDASEHLDGKLERTVRVNAAAKGYAAGMPALVPGALVAQAHHAPGEKKARTTYVMVAEGDGAKLRWRFIVLDAALRVEQRGPMPVCARCHVDAPHQGLFGPPDPPGTLPPTAAP